MTSTVALEPVTRANVRAVCELQLADDQRDLVAPAAFTVAEAHYEPRPLLRAIVCDGVPVGVLLVDADREVPHVVRLMVDRDHQGRGVGRRAVEALVVELRAAGVKSLEVSFVPVPGGAEGFWRACGFGDAGRVADGEPVFRRDLEPAA